MKRSFSITLLVLLIISCNRDTNRSTDLKLKAYFDAGTIPAAIMGNTDDKGNAAFFAYGPAVWGGKDTVSPDGIFRIYSMTKAIASVAAMQLVEQGRIGLDEPLNGLMPEMAAIPILDDQGNLSPSDEPVTLKQLLTHTSGFAYDFTSPKLAEFKSAKWKYADLPRIFRPGTSWNYGTSTDWVGKVIEKISGEDLETYLREHVTGPLKMNSTWFNVPAELSGKIVSWGNRDSTGRIVEYPRLPKEPVAKFSAGGGLYGSPNDYLRFLRCMLNYGELEGVRILKKETVELMLKDQLPTQVQLNTGGPENRQDSLGGAFGDNADRWGLAWAIEANKKEKARPLGAVYWAGAANSYYTLDVPNKIAIVYFTQFFPFNDKESFEFYRLFEREVYASVKR